MQLKFPDMFGPWDNHVIRSAIAEDFHRAGARPPVLKMRLVEGDLPPNDGHIERSGDTYIVTLQRQLKRWRRRVPPKLGAALYWLSHCSPDVRSITVNLSDGDSFSLADFAYSVRTDWQTALPDPHYFQNLGFAKELRTGSNAPAWHDRSDMLVWRGGLNGRGWASFDPNDRFDTSVIQRLRLVQIGRSIDNVDIAFNRMPAGQREYIPFARKEGLIRPPIAENSWTQSKFAIDIDGYANTWSNLLVRMLYGCCVLKIDSHFGYRQWYYPQLRPYEHYIPVSADMRDFAQQLDWARSHPKEAAAIARAGQEFAQSLTFASQTRRAAEIIEGGPLPRPGSSRPQPLVV